MALEGTLKDFSLADILQLISLQSKTGLLTLRSPDDTVTLGFSEGKLVSAESSAKRLDTRLGTVLVKTHRLSPESLQRALEIQSQTLQRLGFILLKNGFCSAEDLRDGLDIQIKKIAFSLFRWTDGDYIFDSQDRIDYDQEYVNPIGVESLLMEGARMMDEWPIIERVVKSFDTIYQRVAVGQPVIQAEDEDAVHDIADATAPRRTPGNEPIKISKNEWGVYELVDGSRTVTEIVERSFLSEFDGCKAFYDLVSRGLVEEAPFRAEDIARGVSVEVPIRRRQSPLAAVLAGLGLAIWGLAVYRFQSWNPLNVLTTPPRRIAVVSEFWTANSLTRLRRLGEAVDNYYLTSGKFPDTTDALITAHLAAPSDLLDPWGRPYRYVLQADKFYLVGFDSGGKVDLRLFIAHTVRQGPANRGDSIKAKGREVIVIN